jgi:hypothetical protein
MLSPESRMRALAAVRSYLAVGDSGRGLLLAEALNGLRGHFERLGLVRARSWEVRAKSCLRFCDVGERPSRNCPLWVALTPQEG